MAIHGIFQYLRPASPMYRNKIDVELVEHTIIGPQSAQSFNIHFRAALERFITPEITRPFMSQKKNTSFSASSNYNPIT